VGETVESVGSQKRCFGVFLIYLGAGGLTAPLPRLNRPAGQTASESFPLLCVYELWLQLVFVPRTSSTPVAT
jgi:hypothetical protein